MEVLKDIVFKFLDSMKIVTESTVNMIVLVMFGAVLAFIVWGEPVHPCGENKSEKTNVRVNTDSVKGNTDSLNFKIKAK